MYKNDEERKLRHVGDIPTLWQIYVSEKPFYENLYFALSIILSILLVLLSFLSKIDSYNLMVKIADKSLNLLPNLLGFNLGAFILIVGFGSMDILSLLTTPLESQKNFSLYQKLNSIFGITIIFQIFSLLFVFCIGVWDSIQNDLFISFHIPDIYINGLNVLGLFIVLFLSTYSILLLINIVKHVFLFAQTIHFCVNLSSHKNEKDDPK